MPVVSADIHDIFIAMKYVCHLQRFSQRSWWLSGKMLAAMPHVWV